MSFTNIGDSVAAGNAAYATIYTTPAKSYAIIGNLVAYNTTGGALNATIAITRQNGTRYVIDGARSIAATTGQSYSGGSAARLTPITLKPGEKLEAQGSGSGINITYSGIQLP